MDIFTFSHVEDSNKHRFRIANAEKRQAKHCATGGGHWLTWIIVRGIRHQNHVNLAVVILWRILADEKSLPLFKFDVSFDLH